MTSLIWRKSSRSMNSGGECVEVAALPDAVGVGDSKNPGSGHLTLEPTRFAALVQRIKNNDLDL
ncbi:MAG TPA: DUF397 domain-containing protein [Actinomadura sp.]|nr:DUF397 domain-containing protein [Actinomadura sp.]